jgi:signal transduction histidine kinase/DNA-binding response OmpR family regulator
MRAKNWAGTPLGDPQNWPQSLQTVVQIMLTSRYAMWMGWGPQLTFFYNDAYRPTLGIKHPWALGESTRAVWKEIWPEIGPRIELVVESGRATYDEDLLLFLERSGFPEETYHTFSYSPLPNDGGGIGGVFCVVVEDTDRYIGQRRLRTMRDLASNLNKARTRGDFCAAVETALDDNRHDLPFTRTYLFDSGNATAKLVCATGIPSCHVGAVDDPALWPLSRVLTSRAPEIVDDLSHLEALPTGAWDKPPRHAVIVPIAQQGQVYPAGAMVIGLNPYRRYDDAYAGFIDLLVGQIASGLADVQAYEEERRRSEALAELDRAKILFFSNISHELRTPLTLMLGPLEECLARPGVPTADRERLEVAHRNSLRLLKLVNSLLDFSRIEAGRMQARYEPTDLSRLTAELASNFRAAMEKGGLEFTVDCPLLPADVYVDRDMWEKIVLNLLSNAFKFTLGGRVTVRQLLVDDYVELSVADTGVGIPEPELGHLFERFHRVQGQRSRTHEGTGIGLALVQELVKLHGGSISVRSREGEGSEFKVAIPVGTAHLPPGSIGHQPDLAPTPIRAQAFLEEALRWLPDGPQGDDFVVSEGASGSARAASPAQEQGARILVADDNADMRDYVRRLLGASYAVETVANGQEAMEAIRRQRPDLVLSDVMMPVLDGLDLLRAIRADSDLSNIPVILLSARAGEEARIEGLDAGADDYLTKPFSARELIARVAANLSMTRMRGKLLEEVWAEKAKLQAVLETIPVGVWFTFDADARVVTGNRYGASLLGMSEHDNQSFSRPAEDRPRQVRAFREGAEIAAAELPLHRAARGEEVREDEIELRGDDATSCVLFLQARPLRNSAGRQVGAVCVGVDITERKSAERRQQLLVNELNHRVKNTLATVQSIVSQSARAGNAEAVAEALTGRLLGLSRVHDLLTRGNWRGTDLPDLAFETLEPYVQAGRLTIDGPKVSLSPNAAVILSMALNELATNAAKYGALSVENGAVEVNWTVVEPAAPEMGSSLLDLHWRERGGPKVSPPTRRGFGSRLIERGLAHELGAEINLTFDPAGVRCRVRVPFSSKVGRYDFA